MKGKRVVIIFSLSILLIGGIIFLTRKTEQGKGIDIQNDFENMILETEDNEQYELPPITSAEQENEGTETVNTHENGENIVIHGSGNNSSDASSDEEKSTSTENHEKSDEQTKSEDKNIDIVGSDDKTEMELPFVPAN